MNTNSVKKLNTLDEGINFYKTYDWFVKNFSPLLRETLDEFWGISFDFKLLCIGNNNNFFLEGSEYFATRIKLNKEKHLTLKLSSEIVEIVLNTTLGYKENFVFEEITELEAKILTEFNNLIYNKLSGFLLKNNETNNIDGETQLAFITDLGLDRPAKILINIPNSFINYQEISNTKERFGLKDFKKTKVVVDLYLGSTKLPLNEIKNIDIEDIILLENSNINNMKLYFNNNEIDFKVSPDPSLIVSFENNDGSKFMNGTTNIWDNIQVDISAEFEKVKISLGEIKNITEGLVVDMGSIYENKVNLKVENKTIAKGELVIINDRYGVMINEICEQNNENEDFTNEQNLSENDITESNEVSDETEEDDFNYDDFEVDDENI